MELKSQIISTKPRIWKGRRNPNILYSLSCLVVEYFGHWLIFYIDREIQEKSILVRNLTVIPRRRKIGYRAPKPLEEEKIKDVWKRDIFCKTQEKDEEVFWIPRRLIKFKGRIWSEVSNISAMNNMQLLNSNSFELKLNKI